MLGWPRRRSYALAIAAALGAVGQASRLLAAPSPPSSGSTAQGTGPSASIASPPAPRPPAADARFVPAADGHLGAWLVVGPFDRARPPAEDKLAPRLDEPVVDAAGSASSPRWRVASAGDGAIDLVSALDAHGKDCLAYAAGVLHVEHPGRHVLLLGADDGVAVLVDGKRVFSRDESRARRDDDDLVPFDLDAGDHTLVLALHQHDGPWGFVARLVGPDLEPPRDAAWLLPGIGADDARAMASGLASATLDRGMRADGYRPVLTVRFPRGAPHGVPLDVRARLVRSPAPLQSASGARTALPQARSASAASATTATAPATASADDTLFDVDAGDVGFDERAVRTLVVSLPALAPADVEDRDWVAHVDVAGHAFDFPFAPRRAVRETVARAERAVAAARSRGGAGASGVTDRGAGSDTTAADGSLGPGRAVGSESPAWLARGSLDSVDHLRDRLASFVAKGDTDVDAQLDDTRELGELSEALERGVDPYMGSAPIEPEGDRASADRSSDAGASPQDPHAARGESGPRTGAMRRAYRSPADGRWSEFALYVPPDFDPHKTYPLVVALHGMNGHPMQMLMWLFGHDDPMRDGVWEDRHPRKDLLPLEAIVVAPGGHYNAMYRELGEDDVMRVLDWATQTYPIDPARVTITGPSMGGIGTAACALHHPDRFAAAEPLCGYHSYFVRSDIGSAGMRPWEKFIAEERSNALWAENGLYLPLYIVHGTKDLPEENSGVLIDRYDELHYTVKHEHPDLGHNVWQTTYEDLKGAKWLLWHHRPIHPRSLRFKTPRTRWADDDWLHVRELAGSDAWAEIVAHVAAGNSIQVSTRGVSALAFDRDAERIDDALPVDVHIDGQALRFQAGEPIELHRVAGRAGPSEWRGGTASHEGPYKHGVVTGPIRDAFHEPLLFVWGASDPAQARANEEAARTWARMRPGVHVDYPVVSDTEFFARGEAVANDRALFLVGNARSNRVVREIEGGLPIRIDGDDVLVGGRRITPKDGAAARSQLGAAFIYPNPRRPDRYVVVVEGVGPLGTWRSTSLPDMLPDYVVFDRDVEAARGMLVLGAGHVRTAGYFSTDWALPPPG